MATERDDTGKCPHTIMLVYLHVLLVVIISVFKRRSPPEGETAREVLHFVWRKSGVLGSSSQAVQVPTNK